VQLAAALSVLNEVSREGNDLIYVCADDTLNKAAKAAGLAVENPNDHA